MLIPGGGLSSEPAVPLAAATIEPPMIVTTNPVKSAASAVQGGQPDAPARDGPANRDAVGPAGGGVGSGSSRLGGGMLVTL